MGIPFIFSFFFFYAVSVWDRCASSMVDTYFIYKYGFGIKHKYKYIIYILHIICIFILQTVIEYDDNGGKGRPYWTLEVYGYLAIIDYTNVLI